MSLFSADSPWGKFGNDIFENSKIGKGYNTIANIAGNFGGDDKAYSGKLGLSDTMPKGNEEKPQYENGIFGSADSKSEDLAKQSLSPNTPLIAPMIGQQASNIDMSGFRPPPGSGILGLIGDVLAIAGA